MEYNNYLLYKGVSNSIITYNGTTVTIDISNRNLNVCWSSFFAKKGWGTVADGDILSVQLWADDEFAQVNSGNGAYVIGDSNFIRNDSASGLEPFCIGRRNSIDGDNGFAFGHGLSTCGSMVVGRYNKYAEYPGHFNFVIGGGTNDTNKFNSLLVDDSGNVYTGSSGTYHTGGADYSEYFEWKDENPNKEDRVGRFVTLDGEKIHYAKQGDEILGIISASPAIVGDDFSESWCGKYETDIFGRVQTEEYTVPEEVIPADKETGEAERTIPSHTEMRMKLNPNFDATKDAAYQARGSRPEWSTVGMLGKLVLIDDGTCAVNGYCQPSVSGDGTATKADTLTNCRVMARLDSTHIKVLLK